MPTPKEVRALRLDVVRCARMYVKLYCAVGRQGAWWSVGASAQVQGRWVRAEVRLIRNLILDDLAALEYELRHGLRKKRRRK